MGVGRSREVESYWKSEDKEGRDIEYKSAEKEK